VTLRDKVTVDLFETRLARGWDTRVGVERPPVPREIELLVNVEFLVTEEDDTSLCDEKSTGNRKRTQCGARMLEGDTGLQFIFLDVG
jgi:hypothetical protein